MMRPLLAIALSILLVLPVRAQDAESGAVPESPAVNCVIEAECLSSLADVASRDGAALTLVLGDGSRKVLTDNREACADPGAEGCVTYALLAYMPASGLFLVGYEEHETGGVLAVKIADGSSFRLASQPVFSPSGQRLASTDAGEDRAYDVTVWSRYQGRWIDQLRLGHRDGDQTVWGIPRWSSEDLVTCAVTGGGVPPGGVARLVWDGQGWQVEGPDGRR